MSFEHLIGKRLNDRFEVESYIAKGGMGAVFRGIQHPLGRPVAIKILTIEDDDSFRERFFNEAAICAALSHPNIVQVFDYGVTDDGVCFIVMELLKGEPLGTMLSREGKLSPRIAMEVMRDVCSAVQDAHDHGVVHRDLKPGNLFVVERQQRGLFVKVLDFGLAKKMVGDGLTTKTGTFLGSPTYISPEQVKGQSISPRTDVYNMGLILYRMLTGQAAFKRDQPSATLVAHCTEAPEPFSTVAPNVELPAGLEWVVFTCLQKNPQRRFASMDELTKALEICQMVLRGSAAPQKLELDGKGRLVVPPGLQLESQLDNGLLRPSPPFPAGAPEPASSRTRPAAMLLIGAGSGLLLFGLLGVAVLGLGAFLFYPAAPEPVVASPDPAPREAPAVEPPPPTVQSPAPEPQEAPGVQVTSVPLGATVFRNNAPLGKTPLTVSIPEDETWEVYLSKPNHRTRKVRLKPDQPKVEVPLEPIEG